MKIRVIKISQIKNLKEIKEVRWSRLQARRLCSTIRKYGVLVPIIIDRDCRVIDGAYRVKAAIRCKKKVITATTMSKRKIAQFKIISNTIKW